MKNLLFIIILFSVTSCKKFVSLDPPQNQLISRTVFERDETAIAALSGLYGSIMRSDYPISYNIANFTGLYSDELDLKSTNTGLRTLYQNALQSQDAPTNNLWTRGYNFIYQANGVIEGLNNANSVTPSVRNQLLGEALFLRAFWHFYLCNLYGDIPLITTTDYTQNAVSTKNTSAVVYAQIIEDLKRAKSLLTTKYVGTNAVAEISDRLRPNSFVVSAFLARVYLYKGDWQSADIESSSVLSDNKFTLEPVTVVFKKSSKEVIWQIELPVATTFFNSYEALYFTITARPVSSTLRSTTISPRLFSHFQSNDLRRSNWIGTYTDASVTPNVLYRYPRKYRTITQPVDEYTTPFRLAEMYLVRAEARTKMNNLAGAVSDLDKIRARAGLATLAGTTPMFTNTQLLDSIAVERQRELFCEWGHRWMDLKRTTTVDQVMSVVTPLKGGVWSPNWAVWPIPLNDIINNVNLQQNAGYQ